ncbi:MAG: hypothetical protein ACD_47C00085G0002 [uncultured bacterium]|uniref:Sugar ABC transporter permease n=1 Tax=Candidatus Wallbacteria bacterium GWC2_49_35 TaxID=1817813 RepID=A0A1F7WYD8_9BACT|nr:MAG: hypothetical protein ACD_47C00085G0002 [uncultured bacterium]OGM07816.1 MAG: sugar ABC transporter permease [Candidatus Wallbacteria bacterium GWC2_49_35]HBC75861.1 sugar ABC transporter permease [Candidatus Wallbacteria bacterium]
MKIKSYFNFKNYKILFLNLTVAAIAILWFIPTLALLISSFRNQNEIYSSGWWNFLIDSRSFTFDNYKSVILHKGIGTAFVNSLIITGPAVLLTVLLSAMAAFPLAFLKINGSRIIILTIVALQAVPIQITLIPVLKMLNSLGLGGSFPAVWLAHTAYGIPFSVYLLRNFFISVPFSLIEAAMIDGANRAHIFFKIVLPLSLPAIASLAIFQFLWVWNDLLVALAYLGGSENVAPLTVKMASMKGSLESGWHIMAASAFISMVLPLAIFLFFQRYFISGITAGAVKQ